jgi:hypothetical protein
MSFSNLGAMTMRDVSTETEQQTFLDAYFLCTNRPPERQVFLRAIAGDLFTRCRTVAYHVADDMVGGFCLGLRPPLYETILLPENIRQAHPFYSNIGEENAISIPMVWLRKELRGIKNSVRIWFDMLSAVSHSQRGYLLYSYALGDKRNWQLYKRGGNSLNIYEGPLTNGATGGVDYLPVHHLATSIALLRSVRDRHVTT